MIKLIKAEIISGFLGAGKTTLIKKLIKEAYAGQKIVLIENEFGKVGIDGGFMREAGIEINEINSGCICCSLVGDFGKALAEVTEKFSPERIIIEPSGVGKLSDVIRAVESANVEGLVIGSATTVVDATKCKMYMANFGEFFCDRIKCAATVILSHADKASAEKINDAIERIKALNPDAAIIATPLDLITGEQIVAVASERESLEEQLSSLTAELMATKEEHHHHHHHHHHDDDDDDEECDDPDCECHHHHDDDDDDDEHEHHHHHHHHDDDDDDDDDEECDDPDCECHHHHHHHDHDHDDHDADDVFASYGVYTAKVFTREKIASALAALEDAEKYGIILRAKGIVAGEDGTFIHFDYVPGEPDVRTGTPEATGMICVIGSNIKKKALAELFGV